MREEEKFIDNGDILDGGESFNILQLAGKSRIGLGIR